MTKKSDVVIALKGFDRNFKCRDFQYEVGKTYTHKGLVKACEGGFHACENPLDVFGYYAPGESRYAIVEQSGKLDRRSDDSKIASSKIEVKAEIGIPELVKLGVEYIVARCTPPDPKSPATNTGDWSAATNTGNWSAATNTGDWSAATVEGKNSVALASGYEGRVAGAYGCALFLVERDINYKIIAAWAGIVGRDGIKPNTLYTLKSGKPVEWTP
ncbi:MAG: hypothetical protein KGL35_00975 [Bradyrhizobium sp.]|nr:hypothetical protein [Bradyrhizobium sp.]